MYYCYRSDINSKQTSRKTTAAHYANGLAAFNIATPFQALNPQQAARAIYAKYFAPKPKTIHHGFLHATRAGLMARAVAISLQDGQLLAKNGVAHTNNNVNRYLQDKFVDLAEIATLLHDSGRPNGEDGEDSPDWEKASADNAYDTILELLAPEII